MRNPYLLPMWNYQQQMRRYMGQMRQLGVNPPYPKMTPRDVPHPDPLGEPTQAIPPPEATPQIPPGYMPDGRPVIKQDGYGYY